MFFEKVGKSPNISDIMLSIRIERDDIFPSEMQCLLTHECKSRLKSSSCSTIDHMPEKKYSLTELIFEKHLSAITRSIIDHEDILESRDKNTLDNVYDSRGFII